MVCTVADPRIHSTRDVNKIIKYNDKIIFFLFSLYIIFLLQYGKYNKKKKIILQYIYVSQKYIYLTS
jgi:hypothetical protein